MPASRLQDPRFEITIPRRLAPVLAEWFRASGGRRSGTSLAIFLTEIVEAVFAPIVEEELEKFLKLRFRPKLDASLVFKQKCERIDRRRKLSEKQIERARQLKRDGTRTPDIANLLRCSPTSIRRHLKEGSLENSC